MTEFKEFKKIESDKVAFGVCSGLAYTLSVKTWMVRVALVLLSLIGLLPATLILYIVLGLMMPKWEQTPEDYESICT